MKSQILTSHTLKAGKAKVKALAYLVSVPPASWVVDAGSFVCPTFGEQSRKSSLSSSSHHESPVLMTSLTPRGPPPHTVTVGGGRISAGMETVSP